MSRGTGMKVNRADPDYVAALREMEQTGTNKFTPGVPGTFKDVPINQPKGDKIAAYGARFRRDNPNGFQIEVRGRRAVVVWLPNK